MKTLVYGFGPFANYAHNVTVDIVREVKRLNIAPAIVFETRFSRSMFAHALRTHQPNIVIGLGQDSRARKIRIERRAINWQKSPGGEGRPITSNGIKYLYVPLKVKALPGTTITYDAGEYVCNYSMYLMCEYCRNTRNKFAFLHLPLSVDVAEAVALVAEIIQFAGNHRMP